MTGARLSRASLEGRQWLLDGAYGTELLRRAGRTGGPVELITLERPELVLALHREYADAGSELLATNTFRANRVALARHGRAKDVRALNRAAVQLSRDASEGRAAVIGTIGPVGLGAGTSPLDAPLLRDAYAEQASALAEAGADALLLETQCELAELALALEAIRSATAIPVGACMSFEVGPSGPRAPLSGTPRELVQLAVEHGAAFVGANCGAGAHEAPELARAFAGSPVPVCLKPSAGIPKQRGASLVYPMDAERFADAAEALFAAGVGLVGGCCGTDPGFIAAIRARRAGAAH
ncbi:MAG TPA: homocysteine S-methyltransferase family protein [Polyangiaceae bacterium]|nr:homocysteine S-methyltransferase family protein [Polyangiaceae bacterium]